MSSIKYRPEIDGLRTLAVIPVILYHMGLTWIPGGFIGVDVFFVISGYLITSIITHDIDRGEFRFKQFWFRRIRRIFPPLVVMLLATSIAGRYLLFGSEINDLGIQGVAAGLSFANICIWRMSGNYWGPQAENSPLLHTWSLSVEEQFYLLYPFLIVGLMTFARRWSLAVMLVLTAVSFSLYVLGTTYDPTATFYLLPTRAWELACGCALAIFTRNQGDQAVQRHGLSAIGLLAVMASYFFFEGHGRQPGALLIPVLGSVLMIYHGGKSGGAIDAFLCHPVTVYIGKISYALYLWHWPILCLHRISFIEEKYGLSAFSMVPLIIVCAMASYHLIEVPVRRQKRAIAPICLALAGSVMFSSFLYREDHSYETVAYSETEWRGRAYDVTPTQEWNETMKRRMQGITVPMRDEAENDAFATGGIIKKYGGDTPDIVVLGDSHALMWAGAIDEISRELRVTVSFNAADGMSPFVDFPIQKHPTGKNFTSDERYAFETTKLECLKKWKPKIVVIAARWGSMRNLQTDILEYVGTIGSQILLIEQPPRLYFGNRNAPQYLSYLHLQPDGSARQYIPTADKRIKMQAKRIVSEIVKKFPFCDAAEIAQIYENDSGEAWVLDGSDVLYIDDDHLSQKGALKAKHAIKDKIEQMLK